MKTLLSKIKKIPTRSPDGVFRHIEVYKDDILKVIQDYYE